METGKALEIVFNMAERLYKAYGEFCQPARRPFEAEDALRTVEDLIVNNFPEEE